MKLNFKNVEMSRIYTAAAAAVKAGKEYKIEGMLNGKKWSILFGNGYEHSRGIHVRVGRRSTQCGILTTATQWINENI